MLCFVHVVLGHLHSKLSHALWQSHWVPITWMVQIIIKKNTKFTLSKTKIQYNFDSQEAHVVQGRLVRKLEGQITESGQTLETVKSQEKVIDKLEGLLQQATQERRAAMTTAENLKQQVDSSNSRSETISAQVRLLKALHV